MPHPIEHSEKCIGPQNAHLLNELTTAYQIALSLASWGCIVDEITSRTSCPVIWLKPTGECKQLESFVCVYGNDKQGRYEINQAEIEGCLIKWKTRRAV